MDVKKYTKGVGGTYGDLVIDEFLKDVDSETYSIMGKITPEDKLCVSIVGARRMTEYGRRACRYIVKSLCDAGVTIISGLMYGIDVEAHRTAIENGGRTIAVLGYGFDFLPSTRYAADIAHKIINKDCGAIISQFENIQPPLDWTFPKRNKVVATVSCATIVIEAGDKSGTLITAGFAADIGREVFVVPGSIFSQMSVGCHDLISMGARIFKNPQDVLDHLGVKGFKNRLLQKGSSLSENEKSVIKIISELTNSGQGSVSKDSIWEAVTRYENTKITVSDFNQIITVLELEGYILSKIKGISLVA